MDTVLELVTSLHTIMVMDQKICRSLQDSMTDF